MSTRLQSLCEPERNSLLSTVSLPLCPTRGALSSAVLSCLNLNPLSAHTELLAFSDKASVSSCTYSGPTFRAGHCAFVTLSAVGFGFHLLTTSICDHHPFQDRELLWCQRNLTGPRFLVPLTSYVSLRSSHTCCHRLTAWPFGLHFEAMPDWEKLNDVSKTKGML